mmetsp:Transcript_23591/g.56851  ORF Transcript_23591/g.56851 Transcript_23591/m.56851 type:complete len:287 (-) Transcript_23591:759-1619(-)
MMEVAPITEKANTHVSKGAKSRESGELTAHAAVMQKGMASSVICVAEPTATPMESSILFFTAKMTAAACSAALPTIGRRMVETKATGMLRDSAAPSMVLTMKSERIEMKTVMTPIQNIEPQKPRISSSSSSSSASSGSSSSLFAASSLSSASSGSVSLLLDLVRRDLLRFAAARFFSTVCDSTPPVASVGPYAFRPPPRRPVVATWRGPYLWRANIGNGVAWCQGKKIPAWRAGVTWLSVEAVRCPVRVSHSCVLARRRPRPRLHARTSMRYAGQLGPCRPSDVCT